MFLKLPFWTRTLFLNNPVPSDWVETTSRQIDSEQDNPTQTRASKSQGDEKRMFEQREN